MVLLDFVRELALASEVPAEANFEEDKGTVLAVEGGGVRGGVDRHSSCVDDVRGSSRSCRHHDV